ncbi:MULTISPECIES: hypothetical protein [unclassified Campylobacter]|uniref:hypothetical protein n=1 Tax=unclassified Campylobacter TaxID=2593542 RepID=UPI003D33A133
MRARAKKITKKVYVCSPYTAILNLGGGATIRVASAALECAKKYYNDDSVELFSPVLANMRKCKNISWDEAMQICFLQLKQCDEIFITFNCISDSEYVKTSKGVYAEFCKAIEQDIPIASDTPEALGYFLQKAQDQGLV